ncbi:hypothetical protein [Streptomyces varsoviensis]|uniref:Uncharacterized protein n=1 Tax=Streptomyces varsoviensis TaxID=67373 RepID=A0ABR5J661_9ACTN|nr:hypothetical protein [Streptomyces varsoviensis]KOG88851.1 hypothetical protein ADK38_17505 [Streptomyces varsoviensis]
MDHELRAEYENEADAGRPDAEIRLWHVVRQYATTAMCGRELSPDAPVRSADAWGSGEVKVCHSCGALLLREAP